MGLEEKLPQGIALTTMEAVLGWARARSPWPVTMGLALSLIHI